MSIIRMIVVEVLASAVFLLPIYFVLNKIVFHNVKKSLIYCIFSVYLVAVYTLVGMPNITYVRFELSGNLLPIVGMIADLKNSILNVLLFVPLGFTLPILWDKFRARKDTVLFGFGMSLAIEVLQIFTLRATDINDLITNVLGTILGYSCANIWMKKNPAVGEVLDEKRPGELYVVCGVVFAVMFFLQPFPSAIMWDMIY